VKALLQKNKSNCSRNHLNTRTLDKIQQRLYQGATGSLICGRGHSERRGYAKLWLQHYLWWK